jgi:DnaJ-class molecular chaperone
MCQSVTAIPDESLTIAPLGSTDPFAFYRVIGVEINDTVPQINVEYKKLAIQYHPDKHDPTEIWTNQFQTLTTIYRTLTNTEARTKYNRQSRLANRNEERDRGRATEPSNEQSAGTRAGMRAGTRAGTLSSRRSRTSIADPPPS